MEYDSYSVIHEIKAKDRVKKGDRQSRAGYYGSVGSKLKA